MPKKKTNIETREELFASDKGEREYYGSKKSLKEPLRLPLTTDGAQAILEIATKVIGVELDDTMVQVFCGFIHHIPQTQRFFTLGDVVALIHNHLSKDMTWKMDQAAKERRDAKAKAEREASEATPLTLAKDADESTSEQPTQ